MVGLCRIALRDGDHARVQRLAANALDLVGDRSADAQQMPLHLLAAGTRLAGDYAKALELYMESVDLARRRKDDRMVKNELHNIGHVLLHLGRVDEAATAFAERTRMVPGTEPYDLAMTALNEAALALAQGRSTIARAKLELTESTMSAAGIVLDPDDAFEVESLRSALEP